MKLHNTLTRQTEEFKPQDPGEVKLYTCGPTVYHYAHIGNLRNVVFNDTLRRVLKASDYSVNHVMNITDVGHLVSDADDGEDKLEKGASREGKTVWEVAEFYIDAFNRHVGALNVLSPTKTVRATDAIPAQIEIIQILLDKGYAYQTDQAIYFDVLKLEDYGKLSSQKLSEKEVGARSDVITDQAKHHPQDFALWFFTVGHFAGHQMRWPTPWGEGFPGWHLECSAIIHETLGEPIDIHTGGVDHIGTHHTNEIAQSEAAFEKPLANYWLHNEHLHQEGSKMSKSDGDTITLDSVIERGFDPLALRLFYLQSHYRSEANFSWESLEAAKNRLKNWSATADLRFQVTDGSAGEGDEAEILSRAAGTITKRLQDDLNTPEALAAIDETFDSVSEGINSYSKEYFTKLLTLVDDVLGLQLMKSQDISKEQKDLIIDRQKARGDKDWAKSDTLRDQLAEQGIGLRDGGQGAIWYRL